MTVRVEDNEIFVGNLEAFPRLLHLPGMEKRRMDSRCDRKGEWTLREDGLYHNPDDEESGSASHRKMWKPWLPSGNTGGEGQ